MATRPQRPEDGQLSAARAAAGFEADLHPPADEGVQLEVVAAPSDAGQRL